MVVAPRERAKGAVLEDVTAMTRRWERWASWMTNWPVTVPPPQIKRYSSSLSEFVGGDGDGGGVEEGSGGKGTSSQCQSVIAAVRPPTPREAADVNDVEGGRGRTVCEGTAIYCWKQPARRSR